MQSSYFDNQRPWNDATMLRELTSPEIAKQLWRTAAGQYLRDEFTRNEGSFLAYVAALHERDRGGSNAAKVAWASYSHSGAK
jgi:hypothetical protein